MRRLLLAASLALLLYPARPAQAQSGPAGEIIAQVNALRASRGLPPYAVDGALMAAAQAQTEYNAANGISSHTGAGGSTPNDRALAAGYGGGLPARATENNAEGTLSFISPVWVVTLWQGDDVHLRAMISPDFEHIGVGYAEANGKAYYTMMVGWVGEAPPPPPEPEPDPGEALTGAAIAPAEPPPPAFVKATPGPDGSIVHTVEEGQSMWLIAANYEVDLSDLLALNGLNEDSFLHAGDTLVIRPADQSAASDDGGDVTAEEVAPEAVSISTPVPGPTARALATPPPRLATAVPAQAGPGPQDEGGTRGLAVGVVIGLAAVGSALVGWDALKRRRAVLPEVEEDEVA